MRGALRVLPALVLALAAASAWAAAGDERQPAVWKSKELRFDYVGFTSRYSCEGLRDKVTDLLLALGARRDLSVTAYDCTEVGRPERFPALQIKISTLAPAGEGATDSVEARWKTVSLAGPTKLTPGDCELAEQIQHDLLPLFTTRNVNARTDCIPHQESAGSIGFTLDVLVPAKH
jgi:hypothetical protein